jgi:uncharacterized coiled-coil protein SlyX
MGKKTIEKQNAAALAAARASGDAAADSDASSGPPNQPTKLQKKAEDDDAAMPPPATPTSSAPDADKLNHIIEMLTRLDTRVTHQGGAISGLSDAVATLAHRQEHFATQLNDIRNKADTEKKELDEKMAKLKALVQSAPSAPTTCTSSSATAFSPASAPSGSKQSPPHDAWAAAAARRHGGGGGAADDTTRARSLPPFGKTTSHMRARTIIAFGFTRVLPRPALLAHFDSVLKAMPDKFRLNRDMFRGGGGKGYSLEITDVAEGAAFIRWISDNPVIWQGPRADDEPLNIRFRLLSSPEDSARGRRLAPIHDWLTKHLEDSCNYDQTMKIKTNTRKGRIAVETEHDSFVIATIVNDELVFDQTSLQYFGFSFKDLAAAASA